MARGTTEPGARVPSGVKVRQVQDGLKIDTTCSAQRPGRVGAGRLAHPRPQATSGWSAPQIGSLVFIAVCGRWPGPTSHRLSAAARSDGIQLRLTVVVRRYLPRPSMRTLIAAVEAGRCHWSGGRIATLPNRDGRPGCYTRQLCDLPLFRIKDHRAGPAREVWLPAQRRVVHADGRWCT